METLAQDFDGRRELGREARLRVPRSTQAFFGNSGRREDPVALLESQATSRVPELIPIRHGRMMVSPFTFYRGAALIMAADLATTPNSGIDVQLCGDAHLSNFGVFGTPERKLNFDINDFDETLPGPWEWDVKRLAASFEVAMRKKKFSAADRRAVVIRSVGSYRKQMGKAAKNTVLSSWYDSLDAEQLIELVRRRAHDGKAGAGLTSKADAVIARARSRDSKSMAAKLVGVVDGNPRILSAPPLVVPVEDLVDDDAAREQQELGMQELILSYQSTLPGERHPMDEFSYVHMARKVVGVGSVGTRAWIVLLTGRDDDDALLLQAKEAQASVLERFLGASKFSSHGERVVQGQRLMQAASDIFLGWQSVTGTDGEPRDFYIRQLSDWKGSIDTDNFRLRGALIYAELCGETLARSHARTGDRIAISAYLGNSAKFDNAIADFSADYADQNEADYRMFLRAISSGRLEAARQVS